jgi:hypothetical protein
MPISASLRELGIPDVIQLMELGQKTGILRVTSTATKDEGIVLFENGRVIHASIRGRPSSTEERLRAAGRISELDLEYARRMATQMNSGTGQTGGTATTGATNGTGATVIDILIDAGTVSPRLVEQETRAHVESVVYELMSWRDGFASFEVKPVSELPVDERVELRAESLLMEGARRADEWARIADRVPDLAAVPQLVHEAADDDSAVDLGPEDFEVLGQIDGTRDVRGIAVVLMRTAFDVAKSVDRLILSGLVEIRA